MICKTFWLEKNDVKLLHELMRKHHLISEVSMVRVLIREQAQKEGLIK